MEGRLLGDSGKERRKKQQKLDDNPNNTFRPLSWMGHQKMDPYKPSPKKRQDNDDVQIKMNTSRDDQETLSPNALNVVEAIEMLATWIKFEQVSSDWQSLLQNGVKKGQNVWFTYIWQNHNQAQLWRRRKRRGVYSTSVLNWGLGPQLRTLCKRL